MAKAMDLLNTGIPQPELEAKTPRGNCDIMGIDLGTTNSAVSIFTADTVPTVLPIGAGGKTTVPSCVRWNVDGTFTVGEEAYKERYKENVIYSVKRIMGSGQTIKLYNENGTMEMTPAAVSSEILRYLKERVAEFYKPIDKCVITVPAYFDQRQINDTLQAAKIAGLECLQILKEPTSASFIYSLLGYAQSGAVLIYDLGGGTFDATHMTFLRKDSVPKKMANSLKKQYGIEIDSSSNGDVTAQYYSRVIGTYGDMQLGGDDIDKMFGDRVLKEQNIKLSDAGREQVYLMCEAFKKRVGVAGEDIVVEDKIIHLDTNTLNECVDAIFDRTMNIIQDIDMSEVSTIVLVGGSTKSPRLRANLQSAFPNMEISAVLDPDATVALGAGAVSKAISNKEELDYSDVLPLPIGVLVGEKSVDICLQRNTSMPYSASRVYYTLHDNQETVTVHVFQGLSPKPEKCTYLGRITVTGIPPKPAGDVCVFLNFLLTGQGRLKIISRVDGVDHEEELVVDNIFTVGESGVPGGEPTIQDAAFTAQDVFEEMVVGALSPESLEAAKQLLFTRRSMQEGSPERDALEEEITQKYFG